MNLPILSYIYTQEDRLYILSKLEQLEQSVFSFKSPFEQQVHELFSLPIAESIVVTAASDNISLSDSTAVQQFVQRLHAEIKALPSVTLRLAFTPSNDLLRHVAIWFESNCGMKIITTFQVDPDLLGGVAVELNGKYLDYSLKKLIVERVSATKTISPNNIEGTKAQ